MNNIFNQIQCLTDQICDIWQQNDSLVSKTIVQMAKLNLKLANSFMLLNDSKMFNAARIIARPIYERSVFLQFILHDRREISSRALLFYHSSRLRQYLWVNYILKNPACLTNFKQEKAQYDQQNKKFLKQNKQSLSEYITDQINNEKDAFNRIEKMVNYCDVSAFDRDERRKTWYRLDPSVFGGKLKIQTLSDVSKYVLNDPQNYFYNLFYGIDSLFTHGYHIDRLFQQEPHQFKIALLKLCFYNLKAMSRYLDLSEEQNKQLNLIDKKIMRLRSPQLPLNLESLKKDFNIKEFKDDFKNQISQNFEAYQFLVTKNDNHALHVLLRTLNEQVISWQWMNSNFPNKRVQLFSLTSQIQTLSDIYRLCQQNPTIQRNVAQIRANKKQKYDQIASGLISESILKRDKQKRQWFALDNVRSLKRIEGQLLKKDGAFMYLYANGFLSVYVHGINLEMLFISNNESVFLLGGIDQIESCHTIVTKLWNLFKEK